MPASSALSPPKAPAQKRGRQTLKRIVEATERLLRTRTFEGITIADIVREADTSIGSFYARFESKEALLPYVYAAYNADTAAAMASVDERGLSMARTLREAVATLMKLLRDGPVRMDGLVRAMVLYSRSHPERLPASAFVRSSQFFDVVSAMLKPHVKAPDAERRARVGAFVAATLLREHRLFPDAPLAKALGVTHEEFAVEVERMTAAYLEAAH